MPEHTPTEHGRTYLLVRETNPMLILRKRIKLSQADFAQHANVSEQYVRREEHGLVNSLSPRTTNTMARLLRSLTVTELAMKHIIELESLTLTEYPRAQRDVLGHMCKDALTEELPELAVAILIDRWYFFWVRCLRNVLAQKIYTHQIDAHMHEFLSKRLAISNPFQAWRREFATQVGQRVFTDILDPTTMLGFCRLIAIHPYTVTQFEGGARESMDIMLTKALLDIGIPQADIDVLEEKQRQWREQKERENPGD